MLNSQFVGILAIVFFVMGFYPVFRSNDWLAAAFLWRMSVVVAGIWLAKREK
jgi:hypothetical protein